MALPELPSFLDFVAFFETEPEWIHPDGWFLGARFVSRRGDDLIKATIAPDDMEFSCEWWQSGKLRFNVSAVLVNSWEIVTRSGQELLRITFNDERQRFCVLQLKPDVQLEWRMTW
ncbi:hypothetical protein G7048_17115 [Diaphorobacter sp. HDW4B]|uniref:hypothetical protein n=1 Tax=Diaphorobacter sp. HDW4B TaxID=2714925 RepID=UPI001409DCFB|nr:hypothetical protein [Diaphorobacter sp. HDW4B]QIL71922.1 hypothetical protein G7048_17115 [Diaphorobacter sp. HDW4B]